MGEGRELFVCFLKTVWRSFIFRILIMSSIYREWTPAAQAPFHGFSQCASLGGVGTFFFGFLLFLITSFTRSRKPSRLLECLVYYKDAHHMLGDTVDPSSSPHEHLRGVPS